MLGKQAFIEFFKKNNIQYIFQLPGLHTLPLIERLTYEKNIRIITGRHESNIVFMADGYARTSGNPGVLIVTAGPGLGNVVSGCMEAFNDDVPLLIIHIDVERSEVSKGILHGIVEPENIFGHFTKNTYLVSDVEDLSALLQDAYEETTSGRNGPVLISIPHTFFGKDIPSGISFIKRETHGRGLKEAGNEKEKLDTFLNAFEKLLHDKKKPIIIGGKALMREKTRVTLDEICRNCSIPFLTTTGGKGALREDSQYAFGNIMRKGLVRNILTSSDVTIAIGTRLRDVDAKRRGVNFEELVHIDIDNHWIDRNYPARLKLAGNIEEALLGIQCILENKIFQWDLKNLKRLQQLEEQALDVTASGYAIMRLIRDSIPEDATIVCDLNIPSYWSEYYLPVYFQNSFLMPRGVSPIFYSIPAAIGAKIGRPDRPCLALCGDGGALPAMAEIATMQQHNIPLVIFIHNNNSFAILENAMIDRYRVQGSMNLTNPDFVRIAQAFGVKAKRTKTLKGLERIFRNEVTWNEPFVIEFVHPVSPPPWRNTNIGGHK